MTTKWNRVGPILLLALASACTQNGLDAPGDTTDEIFPPPQDFDPETLKTTIPALATKLLEGSPEETGPHALVHRMELAIAAGQPDIALAAFESLGAAASPADTPAAYVYRIFAEAQRRAEGDQAAFAEAYQAGFDTVFLDVKDRGAHQLAWYLETPAFVFDNRLESALARVSETEAMSRDDLTALVRAWTSARVHAMTTPHLAELLERDRSRRYVIDENMQIRTQAGVILSAVLVRPRTEAPLPAALVFTIYADANTSRQRALSAASYGYAGVMAYTRGKGDSPEEIIPYEHEAEDTIAVIEWISRQPWSSGEVGMYGASYDGFAAWAATKGLPPALRAIAPYAAALPGQGLPMMNNVFLNANYGWPFFVANNRTLDFETYNDPERWQTLNQDWFASGRPYRQIDEIDGTPNPFLQRWLDHPDFDAYWQAMAPYGDDFADIDIPVLSVTGYYDDGQISALHFLREHYRFRPDAEHYLVIGPYDHFGAGAPRKARELRGYSIDPVAQFNTEALTFAWFDHVFRGAERPALLQDRINYQVMGADRWNHAPSLEEMAKERLRLYLTAAPDDPFHRLSETPPDSPGTLVQIVDFADRETIHNDYYPNLIQGATPEFATGLAFISDPLSRPMELSGLLSGRLRLTINKHDVDLGVRLYEVLADGTLFHLSYWLGRASYANDPSTRNLLTPGEPADIQFDRSYLVSRQIEAGHRLMIVVDVNKNPWHQINYGTGGEVSAESIADAGAPLHIKWATDSFVELPVTYLDEES